MGALAATRSKAGDLLLLIHCLMLLQMCVGVLSLGLDLLCIT